MVQISARNVAAVLLATALSAGMLSAASAGAAVAPPKGQKAVSVGTSHICALSNAGVVKCWGFNGSGQVGTGSTKGGIVKNPTTVFTGASAIATGDQHTCAATTHGSNNVYCWGLNDAGQIGIGSSAQNVWKPTLVKSVGGKSILRGVHSLAAGGGHTCSLMYAGVVKCWGRNAVGTLGNNSEKNSSIPVSVSGLQRVTTLSVSTQVACASLIGETVKCWGYTGDGELGVPPGPIDACQSGEFTHSCAKTPMTVKGVSNAISVSAVDNHVCALLKTGKVECWGANSVTPVVITGLTGVTQISSNGADEDHSCALLSNGTVKCFRYDTQSSKFSPVPVTGLTGAVTLSVGGNTDCSVVTSGGVKCWNDNGVTTTKPVAVAGL